MFSSRNLKERAHLEVLVVDGKMFKEIGWESVDWILLAYDRYQRRAVVSRIMNVWIQ
jgi:hypothetical protein